MEPKSSEDVPGWIMFLGTVFYTMPIWGLIVTWFIGRTLERKHYRRIREREAQWVKVPAITGKQIPDLPPIASAELVVSSVVVSVDHFKRWLSSFRKIFGGEMKSYASVIDRGRREAILRMKERCPDADLFLNCRLETSTVSSGQGKAVGCAEVLAYGTAVRFQK
jgi:uncharacterized protein YbjQ (UPF0145 family)